MNEVIKAVLRRYPVLIAGCLVLGVAFAGVRHIGKASTYGATTEVVFEDHLPKTASEASALAGSARQLVTSTAVVRAAVASLSVLRDPQSIADRHVGVTPVGITNVVQIKVTDGSAIVAAGLANALGTELTQRWVESGRASLQATTDAFARQAATVRQQITDIDSSIDVLVRPSGAASAAPTGELNAALARRDDLARQAGNLDAERIHLTAAASALVVPAVIQAADVPNNALPSGTVPDLALGALLGLLVGAAIALALETVRPHILDARAQAAYLHTPMIGEVATMHGSIDASDIRQLAVKLWLRATSQHVAKLTIVAIGEPATRGFELADIAGSLRRQFLDIADVGSTDGTADTVEIDTMEADDLDAGRAISGVVVFTPAAVGRESLRSTEDLCAMAGWPVIGLVAVQPDVAHRRGWRHRVSAEAAPDVLLTDGLATRRSS